MARKNDGHEETVGSQEMQSTCCMGREKVMEADVGKILIPDIVGQKAAEKLKQLSYFCSGRSGGPRGWIAPGTLQLDESARLLLSLGPSSPHQASSDMEFPPVESLGSTWSPLAQHNSFVGLQKETIRSSPRQFLLAFEVMVNGSLGRGRHSSPQQEMPNGLLERPRPGSPHFGTTFLPPAPLKVYIRKKLKSQQQHDQKKDQISEQEIGEGDGARVPVPLMIQNGSDVVPAPLMIQNGSDAEEDGNSHNEQSGNDGDGARVSAPLMIQNESDAEQDELTGNSHREKFVNNICRRPSGILPVPDNTTQRQQPSRSTFSSAPRSRRVAGIGVEFQMQDLGSRSTKRAMRTLQIITEYEGISQEAIEEYKKLFTHPLSQCHIEALSAFLVGTLRQI
jgi:hypothetical protein